MRARTPLPLRLRALAYVLAALGIASSVAAGIVAAKSVPEYVAPTHRLGGHGWFLPEQPSRIEFTIALDVGAAILLGLAAAAATAVGFRKMVGAVVCLVTFCLLGILTVVIWILATPGYNEG